MFGYKPISDKKKVAHIYPYNWTEVNVTLEFDEMTITSSDKAYRMYFVSKKEIKTFYKESKESKAVPTNIVDQPIYLDIKKVAAMNWGKMEEPSRIEKFICFMLQSLEVGKFYKGSIQLQDSGMLDMIITGEMPGGVKITDEQRQQFAASIWKTEESEPKLLNLADCEVPKEFSGTSSSKSQGETDKLNDRMEFIKAQLAITCPDLKVASIHDLLAAGMAKQGFANASDAMMIVDACLKLMGCQSWFDKDVNG
jgi:hypothetical protein